MTRIGLLHDDPRVRELYRAILEARGHGVVDASLTPGARDPAIGSCDLVVAQVTDELEGLERLQPLLGPLCPPLVCLDDDPSPGRDRWLHDRGAARVLHGPVSLRALMDAVTAVLPSQTIRPTGRALRSARIDVDSAGPRPSPDVRGAIDRGGRHLLLTDGQVEVALHCFPRPAGVRIRGTVLGPAEPILARVSLKVADRTFRTRTDPAGSFQFESISGGVADLDVQGRAWTLHAHIDLAVR